MPEELQSFDRVLKTLTDIPKQVAFATSRALNDTAREIQQFTVSKLLPEKFILRSKGAPWFRPGTKYGFNISFSTKTRLEARIGSQADWLRLQEEGGIKRVSGHRLAIPTEALKPKSAIMRRAWKPRVLLKEASQDIRFHREHAKGWRITEQGGFTPTMSNREKRKAATVRQNIERKVVALQSRKAWMHYGRGMPAGIYIRKGSARLPIMKLYALDPEARIHPVLEFVERGSEIANRVYLQKFNQRLIEAILGMK